MATSTDTSRIAMQVARDVVVASIQVDLSEEVIIRFREDLLHRLQESGSHGVILDVSGLETLDAEEFEALRRIITMSRIMGAEAVLAGLRPGVVSALVETGVDTDGLRTAIDLDAAFALLLDASGPAEEADEGGSPEDDAPESGRGVDSESSDDR